MEKAEKEIFAIELLRIIDKKREQIKALTSEIMELENDPKNVVRIKKDVQSVLNAVASCSNPRSNYLEILRLEAKIIFDLIRFSTNRDNTFDSRGWHLTIVHRLEDFCISANTWNPIEFDFNKKGLKIDFKNLNILGININK